ncbi:MAG TPA: nitroreductase/quinone reductase family protein [Nocardioides sp.]|nr:nitroreductase/quinone reductase family protein [Nocardioides sp.]
MDFNQQIIDAFRTHGGDVQEPVAFGRTLILVHIPRRDGSVRPQPLRNMPDGDAWMVAGSAGGSPRTPGWVHALRRVDEVDIEVPADPAPETVRVRVEELEGAAYERAWGIFKETEPGFAAYEEQAGGRRIPVFRFTRI